MGAEKERPEAPPDRKEELELRDEVDDGLRTELVRDPDLESEPAKADGRETVAAGRDRSEEPVVSRGAGPETVELGP